MVGHRLDLHRLGFKLCCLSRYDRTVAHSDTLYIDCRGHQSMASLLLILSSNSHRLLFDGLWDERKTNEIGILVMVSLLCVVMFCSGVAVCFWLGLRDLFASGCGEFLYVRDLL